MSHYEQPIKPVNFSPEQFVTDKFRNTVNGAQGFFEQRNFKSIKKQGEANQGSVL